MKNVTLILAVVGANMFVFMSRDTYGASLSTVAPDSYISPVDIGVYSPTGAKDKDLFIKDVCPMSFSIVFEEFGEPYEKIGEKITAFSANFFKQGLRPASQPVGIFYDSPRGKSSKWEIGYIVQGPQVTTLQAPLKRLEYRLSKVARYAHVGPFEKLADIYDGLAGTIAKNGYEIDWPVFVIYNSDPQVVPAAELRQDVLIPLRLRNEKIPARDRDLFIKDASPMSFSIVSQLFSGPYKEIPQRMTLASGNVFKQGHQPASRPVGIFYGSPRSTTSKWEIGYIVENKKLVQPPLKRQEYKFNKVARYVHVGPFEELASVYDDLVSTIGNNGYQIIWPIFVVYNSDPEVVPAAELRQVVLIPLLKKSSWWPIPVLPNDVDKGSGH